jgi:hypothetical protein
VSASAVVSRAKEAASGEVGVRALESRPDAASKGGPDQASRAPEPVGGPWVTCYGNYRPTSTPERDVIRLGLLCGPANGMRLEGATITGEATDAVTEHAFDVRAGDCFRVLAVAGSSVPDLAVEVRNPKGVPVASDHNNDRWPILNPDGPFCLLDAGKHTVRVHARQGRGRYALQIWRLP